MAPKKSHKEFLQAFKALNSKITVLGTYTYSCSKVAVKCDRCGYEWAPVANSLLQGHGCPKCGGTMQKTHEEFVEELKTKRKDVVIISRYEKALKKATFRFLKCGHEWDMTPAHILSGRGCPECAHSRRGATQRLTMDGFLERLHKIDPNLVVREGGKYINYNTHIPLRCNSCKYEYEISPLGVLDTRGCPNCHRGCTSFLEQFIYYSFVQVLGESKVISRDKTAIGAELDIYIPELKAAIEPGSWYWHKKLVDRDLEKQLLCKNKGIRLITIYDHYDGSDVPFEDCIVTPCDINPTRNRDKLIEIVRNVFSEFGLHSNPDESDWEEISRKAQKDSRRITTEEFKKELSEINEKVEIIGEYTAANSKIKARCKICSHEWYVAPTTLRRGSGCLKCSGSLTIEHTQFIKRLNLLQPDMIPLTEYVNMKTKVTVKCRVCGHIWSGKPLHLISKSGSTGCRKCSGRIRRTHDDFVAEIARISSEIKIIGMFVSITKPVLVQCAKCSEIWEPYPVGLLWGSNMCNKCHPKNVIRRRKGKQDV